METVRDKLRNPWVKLAGACLALIALGWMVYEVSNVLVAPALGLALAYILSPAVDWLQARKIPRWVSSPSLVLGLVIVVAAGAFLLARDIQSTVANAIAKQPSRQQPGQKPEAAPQPSPAPAPDADDLPPKAPAPDAADRQWLEAQLEGLVSRLPEKLQPLAMRVATSLYDYLAPRMKEIAAYAAQVLAKVARSVGGVIAGIAMFVLSLVISVYLLIDLPDLKARTIAYLPLRYRADILRLARAVDVDLRSFVRGQLLVSFCLTLIYFAGLQIAGIPYAAPVALIGGIGNMVPYVGSATGILLAEIASLFTYGFDVHMLYVLIVFAVGQTLEATVISPRMLGGAVRMNPALIIVSFLVFAKLFGFLGAIFAVPLALVVRVLGGEVLRRIGCGDGRVPDGEPGPPENNAGNQASPG